MYLPQNPDTKKNLYSNNDLLLADGSSYVGFYHYKNNIPYTGKENDIIGIKRLYEPILSTDVIYDEYFYSIDKKIIYNYTNPVLYYPKLKSNDYDNGYFTRYFVKRKFSQDTYIVEIDKKQYDKYGTNNGIDKNIYDKLELNWKISGYKNDIIDPNTGLIISYGIQDTNIRTLKLNEQIMPGISKYLANSLQFAKIKNNLKN